MASPIPMRARLVLLGPLLLLGCAFRSETPIERAQKLEDEGLRPEAERVYRDVLAAEPGDPEARYRLACLLAGAGRREEALAEFDRLLARSGAHVPALLQVASLHREAGRLDEADALLRRGREAAPRDPLPLLGEGRVLEARGDRRAAAERYEAALRIDPNSARAHFRLGDLRFREKRLEEARTELRRAAELDGRDPDPALRLADVAEALGRPGEAVAALQRYTALRPRDAVAFRRLAELELKMGEYEAALRDFWEARARDPNLAGVSEGIFRASDGLAHREQDRARTEVRPEIPPAQGK